MTDRTKAELAQQIATLLADNNMGDITAQDLRSVFTDVVDSMAHEDDVPELSDDSILDLAQASRNQANRGQGLGVSKGNENTLALLNFLEPRRFNQIPQGDPILIGDVVEHNGGYYGALTAHNRGSAGPNGDAANWQVLSNFQGAWRAIYFAMGTFVTHNGHLWVATGQITNAMQPGAANAPLWVRADYEAPPDTAIDNNQRVTTKGLFTQALLDLIIAGNSAQPHLNTHSSDSAAGVFAAHLAAFDHPSWFEITADFDHTQGAIDYEFRTGQYWYLPPYSSVARLIIDTRKINTLLGILGADGSIAKLQAQISNILRHGSAANLKLNPSGIDAYADIDREYTFEFINPAEAPAGVAGVYIQVSRPEDTENTGVGVSTRIGINASSRAVSFQITAARKLILDSLVNEGVNLHELEFRFFFYDQDAITAQNIVRSDAPNSPSLAAALAVVNVPFYIGARPGVPNTLQAAVDGATNAGVSSVVLPSNYTDWAVFEIAMWNGDDVLEKSIATAVIAAQASGKSFLAGRDRSGSTSTRFTWTTATRTIAGAGNDRIIYAALR